MRDWRRHTQPHVEFDFSRRVRLVRNWWGCLTGRHSTRVDFLSQLEQWVGGNLSRLTVVACICEVLDSFFTFFSSKSSWSLRSCFAED